MQEGNSAGVERGKKRGASVEQRYAAEGSWSSSQREEAERREGICSARSEKACCIASSAGPQAHSENPGPSHVEHAHQETPQ